MESFKYHYGHGRAISETNFDTIAPRSPIGLQTDKLTTQFEKAAYVPYHARTGEEAFLSPVCNHRTICSQYCGDPFDIHSTDKRGLAYCQKHSANHRYQPQGFTRSNLFRPSHKMVQPQPPSSGGSRKISFNVSDQYDIQDVIGEGAYGVVW